MKVLVTGIDGQLGYDVVRALRAEYMEVKGTSRIEMDITSEESCRLCIQSYQPDVIIHCAAYTAVDQAEVDVEEAYRVNAAGTRNIAVAAENTGAKLVYISTDYVFDGKGDTPYHEYDNTNPQGIYGKSKRAGEIMVQSLSSRYFIVRTSWVFGINGNNFVKTMLKFAQERPQLKVVHDQVGSPTYTVDLAHFLCQLIQTDRYGIYHASNTGICSWYEFACAIFKTANVEVDVLPCTTEEFPRPAPRPKYSVMECLGIKMNDFDILPPWQDALKRFLDEYNSNK